MSESTRVGRQSGHRIMALEVMWCPGESGRFLVNRGLLVKEKFLCLTWNSFRLTVKSNWLRSSRLS